MYDNDDDDDEGKFSRLTVPYGPDTVCSISMKSPQRPQDARVVIMIIMLLMMMMMLLIMMKLEAD